MERSAPPRQILGLSWVRLPSLRSPRAKDQVPMSPSCGAAGEAAAAALASTSGGSSKPLLQQAAARLHRRESVRNRDAKKCQYRSQLEQEVQKLQEQLQEENDLHVALAAAIRLNASSSKSPHNLPRKARELVDNIMTLETTVSKLEQELSTLRLSVARARYERELYTNNDPGGNLSSPSPGRDGFSNYSWEEQISSLRPSKRTQTQLPVSSREEEEDEEDEDENEEEEGSQSSITGYEEREQPPDATEPFGGIASPFPGRNLWRDPNKLSEEMVRCMRSIFLCLSESNKIPSSGTISKEIGALDPYGVHGKPTCASTGGAYSSATEVSWMVVGQKQLHYAAEALRVFRLLVEQLAGVSPGRVIGDQRLAFWINLYNALVMHAYLAYGVPRNEAKHSSLMQKVSYNVGGRSISAADMECDILKMKPAAYRPHSASVFYARKFRVSEEEEEEENKFAVDCPEPLAMFGLSCGMYSSPAVRIFTGSGVKEELEMALRDYVRASVGIGLKGKLLVPKLVHCFASAVGIEDSLLVDWICRFLSPDQASEVRNSASHRKQRLLGARSFIVVPFETRFRYLLLSKDKD